MATILQADFSHHQSPSFPINSQGFRIFFILGEAKRMEMRRYGAATRRQDAGAPAANLRAGRPRSVPRRGCELHRPLAEGAVSPGKTAPWVSADQAPLSH